MGWLACATNHIYSGIIIPTGLVVLFILTNATTFGQTAPVYRARRCEPAIEKTCEHRGSQLVKPKSYGHPPGGSRHKGSAGLYIADLTPRPGRPHFSNFSPPAERRPFCKKVFGLGKRAWFSRFGRPRGAVGHFSRFGAHLPSGVGAL